MLCASMPNAVAGTSSEVTEVWQRPIARAALLSVAWRPQQPSAAATASPQSDHAQPSGIVACSSMDGSVSLVAATSGTVLTTLHLNSRLVTTVAWLHHPPRSLAEAAAKANEQCCYVAAATGAATLAIVQCSTATGTSGAADSWQLSIAQIVPYAQNVAHILQLPEPPRCPEDACGEEADSGAARGKKLGNALLIAVKGSNRLRCCPLAGTADAACSGQHKVLDVQVCDYAASKAAIAVLCAAVRSHCESS